MDSTKKSKIKSKKREHITIQATRPAKAGLGRRYAAPVLSTLASEKQMTIDDLTVNFSHLDRATLLSDWRWLIGSEKLPILLTAGGDAFVQDKKSNSVYFLSVNDGSLTQVAVSGDEFRQLLNDRDFVFDRFSVRMISDLRKSGRYLNQGKIYSFIVPLVLGGKCEIDNVEVTDIGVHFSLSGQIHEQVKDLPPGTSVGDIKFLNKSKSTKKWWQIFG